MYGGGGGGRGGWRASKVALSISVIIFNKKKKGERESTAKSARVVRPLLAHTRVLSTAEIPFFFISTVQPLTRTAAPFTCVSRRRPPYQSPSPRAC